MQSDVAAASDNDPRPLIVIDPGHGGIDSGTKGLGGEDEKDIVLAFGLKLRDTLTATGKYRVAMTRSDDTFIPLQERVQFARKRKASLFISIHADLLPRSEGVGEGASVYTLSEHASDAEAAKLADKENKSDIIAGVDLRAQPDDVANILIDLAQRETKTFSVRFARTLVGDIKPVAPLHLKPVKAAGFVVLKAPDVPSVLVELGYMSTRRDLKNLISPDWRAQTAQAWRGRSTTSSPGVWSAPAWVRADMGYRPQFQHKTRPPRPGATAAQWAARAARPCGQGRGGAAAAGPFAYEVSDCASSASCSLPAPSCSSWGWPPSPACCGTSPRTCRTIPSCRITSRR